MNKVEDGELMNKKKIIVVTNPMIAANRSAEVTLSKFLRIIRPSVESIQVIGGNLSVENDLNDIQLISFPIARHPNKFKRMLSIIGVQLKMMGAVIRTGQKGQPAYFWIADKMLLPYFAAKMKGMEVNYFIYGNVEKEGTQSRFTALSGKLIRFMASNADYVCMESPSVKSEWKGLKAKNEKIVHLYTDVFEKPTFEHRKRVIGMVCRLTPGKHIVESIEAMQEIHKKYPEWRLEIIGSGKQQQECEELIKRENAEAYVDLLGWVEHSDLQNYTRKWKYLLFPTDTEGMPNGLIEMMGCGIPAIASAVGGIADIVRDSDNGFILRDCTVEAISKGIEKAICVSEVDYQKMAGKAYLTIKNEFTLEAAQKESSKYL